MTTLTEQEKTVLLAEKVLQRTCIKHFDDVILTDENGHFVQYFNPFTDWNHTHMVLDKVMEDEVLWWKFLKRIGAISGEMIHHIGIFMETTKEQQMDAVLSLITI